MSAFKNLVSIPWVEYARCLMILGEVCIDSLRDFIFQVGAGANSRDRDELS